MFCLKISILEFTDGARHAEGLTVIIDVFRAFSLEAYLYSRGAAGITAVGSLEEAFRLKKEHPGHILIGERGGKKCDGCDFGNSPSQTMAADVRGKYIIHTTSAGTQGITNAVHADEIISGSLVNASAVASYILSKQPADVSIVAMGTAGVSRAREDFICAEYIRSLIEGSFYDIDTAVSSLRTNGGGHFFNPETQEIFPKEDFLMCTKHDLFNFIIRAEKSGTDICQMEKINL